MRVIEPGNGFSTNAQHGKAAAESRPAKTNGKSAADDADWFCRSAQELYEHKPGTILHVITGLGDERLCQRYASGEVRPPAYFLRALLRSDHGAQWLTAVMAGCERPWWIEHQRAAAVGRQVLDITK